MGSKESITFNKFEVYSNEGKGSVDLRSGTPRIEYRESVFLPYVSVTCAIVDTGNSFDANDGSGSAIGLLEAIKCQGTEKVLLNIEDGEGNKIDLSKDTDLRVSNTSHIIQSFKSTSFILTMVSKEAFDNTLLDNRVRRRFDAKISEIAKIILKQDLKTEKNINDIDETINDLHQFGGDRYPFEMLLDIQKLAIPNIPNAKGKMAGYLFWQTSKGFHFKSLDKLFDKTGKKIKRYILNNQVDRVIPPTFDDKILHSRINRTSDALAQFESGAYGTKLEIFDDVNKTYTKKDVLTSKEDGNGVIAGKSLPTVNPEYKDKATVRIVAERAKGQTFSAKDSFKTQAVDKTKLENLIVEEVLQQSQQNYRQKFNMSADIIIPADFSLHAGDIIYCEFPELSTKSTLIGSRKDSGIYMIADLCHFGNSSTSFTGLHLVRDSYGVK